ncbi:MAG: hypothetical protein NDI61_06995 [Bdellovibrionaceae bacterium]|nr:hypothetical protein [Pseudobdellovibrionaceae bacterium]
MGASVRSMASLIPLVACATVSMGNQGCEEQQDKTRVLRMEVKLAKLSAHPVRLPSGEVLDFQSAANTLFYGQVMNNKHFVIANTSGGSSSSVTSSSMKSESVHDVGLLSKFGFNSQVTEADASAEVGIRSSRADFGATPPVPSRTLPTASAPQSGSTARAAACLYDSPQAILGGEVISFETSRGTSVRVGYAQNGSTLTSNAAGSVRFEQTKLDLRMRTDDPLSRQGVVVGDGTSYSSKVDVRVDFMPGIPIGLDFFYKTALADVIKKAMDKSLAQIVARYKKQMGGRESWDDVWESRVLYDPVIADNDTHIAIRGGYRASIRIGDRFRVTNAHYVWEGAECSSTLRYRIPLTMDAGALAEVVSVGDNVAVARVLENPSESAILPGAIVKIESLIGVEKPKPDEPRSRQSLARN